MFYPATPTQLNSRDRCFSNGLKIPVISVCGMELPQYYVRSAFFFPSNDGVRLRVSWDSWVCEGFFTSSDFRPARNEVPTLTMFRLANRPHSKHVHPPPHLHLHAYIPFQVLSHRHRVLTSTRPPEGTEIDLWSSCLRTDSATRKNRVQQAQIRSSNTVIPTLSLFQ